MKAREGIRLVAFDMEGCLTGSPTVWELVHRKNGTWDSHGLPYWERFLAGDLEYDEFARMDVAAWRGAPASHLHEAAREVPLATGCAELLRRLRERGVCVAVISNGLARAAERFRSDFGAAHIFANRAVVRDGLLTGELRLAVPYARKGDVLSSLARELGLARENVAAVGDGPADVGMFCVAGIGVAVGRCDASVRAQATHTLPDGDLAALYDILLPG